MATVVHNPDRFMTDFREIISKGQKKVGFLIGAGAPMSIKTNKKNEVDQDGEILIPGVTEITELVKIEVSKVHKAVLEEIINDIGGNPNIESILTRVRQLQSAIGSAQVYGYDAKQYSSLATNICQEISKIINKNLPTGDSSYTRFISWIGGTERAHSIELFTTNYDLLFEEAFEKSRLPYYDGFTGGREPFFDAASISGNYLPHKWSKLWKIHGSLGWALREDRVIRTGKAEESALIYPEQMKYDQIQKLPYAALFERLKDFLKTPDTLLVTAGFSYYDAHICSLIEEGLSHNPSCSVFAFNFGPLKDGPLKDLALKRSNVSAYAADSAIINSTQGEWLPGDLPYEEWKEVRNTYWQPDGTGKSIFTLGCFDALSRFLVQARSETLISTSEKPKDKSVSDTAANDSKKIEDVA